MSKLLEYHKRGAPIEDTWGSVEGSILLANWSKGYSRFNLTSLCYLFTGPSERSIHLAKLEVKRVVKEEMIRLVSTYPLFSPRLFFLFLHTCLSRVLRAVKRVFYETDQMSLSYKLSNISLTESERRRCFLLTLDSSEYHGNNNQEKAFTARVSLL